MQLSYDHQGIHSLLLIPLRRNDCAVHKTIFSVQIAAQHDPRALPRGLRALRLILRGRRKLAAEDVSIWALLYALRPLTSPARDLPFQVTVGELASL